MKYGEYVRTKEGYIGTLININMDNWNYLTIDCKRTVRRDKFFPENYLYLKNENIVKHSKNIIDLIEVGDYVNGHKIIMDLEQSKKYYNSEDDFVTAVGYTFSNEEIETVVTKEQFESIKYKVEG